MKILVIVATILGLISCSSKVKKQVEKSDTSAVFEALYVINGNTLALTGGPVKRLIITKKVATEDSTTEAGVKVNFTTDTIYLLPSLDTTLLLKDTTGKAILDSKGQPQYHNSFRAPLYLNKQFVYPTTIQFPNIK